jgi:hypothetical protein
MYVFLVYIVAASYCGYVPLVVFVMLAPAVLVLSFSVLVFRLSCGGRFFSRSACGLMLYGLSYHP